MINKQTWKKYYSDYRREGVANGPEIFRLLAISATRSKCIRAWWSPKPKTNTQAKEG